MLPDRVSNPGPLTYESGALPIALCGPAQRGIIPQKNVGGVQLLISASRLVMLYISTKFCEIISNGIKVIERTRFLYGKLQRGIIPQKM